MMRSAAGGAAHTLSVASRFQVVAFGGEVLEAVELAFQSRHQEGRVAGLLRRRGGGATRGQRRRLGRSSRSAGRRKARGCRGLGADVAGRRTPA